MNVIERSTFAGKDGYVIALLENTSGGPEPYIVGRDYDHMTRQWYGGGTYYADYQTAVNAYLTKIYESEVEINA